MGYGPKIKKPSFTKDTALYTKKDLPKVLIPVDNCYTLTAKEGDRVLVGQMIGVSLDADIPLLSSISGKVEGVVRMGDCDYISIKNDGKYEKSKDLAPCKARLSEIGPDEIIERMRLYGIKEWKLLQDSAKIKRLAVNCIDRDVYSNTKKCIIQKRYKELVGGAKIIMKLTGVHLCEFIIERSETDSINRLLDGIGDSSLFDIIEVRGACSVFDDSCVIDELPNAEKLKRDELLIISPETLSAVYRAFATGEPYIKKAVTISGALRGANGTFILPIGTPIGYLYDTLLTSKDSKVHVIQNGAMTGELTDERSRVITQDTHALTFISERELTISSDACIGCGRCDKVCPQKLLPSLFVEKCEEEYEQAVSLSGMDWCSDCGACSYVCPAKIPIQKIAKDRQEIAKPNQRHKRQTIDTAPFVRSAVSTRDINLDYLITLFSLLAFSCSIFGVKALFTSLVSVLVAVISDVLFSSLTNTSARAPLSLSSAVCGMTVALTMTVQTPLYVTAIGSFFAIMIVRGAFGGCYKNILHSAFCARIFVSLLFHDSFLYPDKAYTTFDRLLGNTAGGYGEVSVIILCACALYLAFRRLLPLLPLVSTLSTFAAITFLTAEAGGARERLISASFGSAILFVAIFASSEPSSIPKGVSGRLTYGVLCGAVGALITRYTSYEGAYAASVIASAITIPLFSRLRQANPYADGTHLIYKEAASEPPIDILSEIGIATDIQDDTPTSQEQAESEAQSYSADASANTKNTTVTEDIVIRSQEEAPASSKAQQNLPASESIISTLQQTSDFRIESAEELLEMISAEVGLEKEKITKPATERQSAKECDLSLYSTALFDKLYDEMDLDDDPDGILNIKR